jgi:hypothetical protein
MIRSLAIVYAAALATASAGLEFKEKAVDIEAKPTDENLPVEFPFTNTGDKPVTVQEITYACSCLDARTDKKIYAPGEEGVLKAIFKLGSFTGYQRKAMTVVAVDDGADEAERTQLMVGVKIPDVVKITPELLSWTVGEDPQPKVFTIEIPHTDPIGIKQITCSRPGFDFELEVKEQGRLYQLTLVPESTKSPMLGVLKIETDCEIAKHQRQLAFFSVARKKRGGS